MSTKVRKQIYIEQRQARFLKREAGARGVSEAALLRQAIDNVVPELPRGGDDPAAFDGIIRYARGRLANAKRRARADGRRRCLKAAIGRKGGTQARQRRSDEKRRWTRDDIYEERLSRYGKSGTR